VLFVLFAIAGIFNFLNSISLVVIFIIGIIVIVGSFITMIKDKLKAAKTYKNDYHAYLEKLSEYNKALDKYSKAEDAFKKERIEALEKAKSISESDDSRQSSLKKSLAAWENRPKR
jgi:cell division protein FtsW (lipid II flippase)